MTGITLRGVSLNAQWPGFTSTRLKAAAWAIRRTILVSAVKKQNPDVILVQELGETEAAQFFARMGSDWRYQRRTLNCVGWKASRFGEGVDTLDLDLPSYGQYPRSAVVVKLRDKAGNRLRLGATHLTVKTSNDAAHQQAQVQMIVSKVNDDEDDWPLVIGVDTNNRQRRYVGMWAVLKKYGWTWESRGIDAVLTNFGASLRNVRTFGLGRGSDHDGIAFDLTTNRK